MCVCACVGVSIYIYIYILYIYYIYIYYKIYILYLYYIYYISDQNLQWELNLIRHKVAHMVFLKSHDGEELVSFSHVYIKWFF